MIEPTSESECYILQELEEYKDITELNKKIILQLLKRKFGSPTDYDFNDYDVIFEKATQSD